MTITIDVALTQGLAGPTEDKVCVVVDVLRASSTLTVMFAQGVEEVVIAPSIDKALRLAQDLGPAYLLCGEVGGLPPAGFDYGNSPSEFSRTKLDGKRAIIATTNGGKLLASLCKASQVFVGSILNATAVAKASSAAAQPDGEVLIVCAGESGGTGFSLADAIGAGAIIAALCEHGDVALSDGAKAALALCQANKDTLEATLANTIHGRGLVALGLADDVRFCAREDVYQIVPQLAATDAEHHVLRAN